MQVFQIKLRPHIKGIFVLPFLLACFAFQLVAQNEERRQVGDFQEVSVIGNIVLHLIPDEQESLRLESRRESPRNIITERKGPRLVIKMRAGIYEYQKVHAYLSYRELSLIKVQAGARVKSDYVIDENRLEIHAGSGSQVGLEVDTKSLSLRAGEGAEIMIWGNSNYTEAASRTGAMIHAENLMSEEVYAKVNTGGEASIYAKESIEGKAATGGVLKIEGNPKYDHVYTNLGGQVWK